MNETPFFIGQEPHRLFATLHEPEAGGRDEAFVFCHPLAEEKLWAHRAFVTFARQLAAEGYPVLRADLTGAGDSDGDFSEVSVTTAIADIRRAIDAVRGRLKAGRVSLLGLRFGATLASLVAERYGDVDRLVLWSPIVDGNRHLQDLLRINVATQTAVYREVRQDRGELVEQMRQGGTVNVDGYEMGYAMCSEMAALKLAAAPKAHRGPCLVVQIDRQPGRQDAELEAFASTYKRGVLAFAQEEPFWKEIARFYDRAPALFATTSEWLRVSA
jgi:exosortase A-associated hydrolase 2